MKIDITETATDFEKYPSESKAHLLEANTGVDLDFGYHASRSNKPHENLINVDPNSDPF